MQHERSTPVQRQTNQWIDCYEWYNNGRQGGRLTCWLELLRLFDIISVNRHEFQWLMFQNLYRDQLTILYRDTFANTYVR